MPFESARPDFAGTSRFELVRVVGTGGMGVVYEALDRERQARVALKTLRTLEAEALLRFKNEFRSLQDLQHPNLVSLGELREEGGVLFFTMELVRGVDFFEHVRPREGADDAPPLPARDEDDLITAGPESRVKQRPAPQRRRGGARTFDEARLRSALGQLARGLFALHAAQKVHRDIKPSNVLVTEQGRVVILDFGLVTDVAHSNGAHRGEGAKVVGTAHFMAPEQAAARPVGPEADWYSMGVMLYLALTGVYPFQLASEVALDLKQRVEPTRPGLLVDDLPPDLEALCVDLLRLDAAARPSGREVLERLAVAIDEVPGAPILGSDFVGRRHELATLDALLDEARRGRAVTVLVEGESGVGKSALLRHFLERHDGDAAVFAGRCYERESVPYKAVDELVDALSRHVAALPEREAEAILPAETALLASVFPLLRRIPTVARAPRARAFAIDPLELRKRVFGALRELLRGLAARGPLILAVDDLQWADADSLALLTEAIRPPNAPPLLLVATLRTNAAANDAAPSAERCSAAVEIGPQERADRLFSAPIAVHRLALRTLPPGEAEELVTVLLRGAEGADAVSAAAIAEEAGGHPLFIDALVRHRLARGEDAGPVRLDQMIWSRVGRLDPAAQRLLELVAVAGGPLHRDVAVRAASIDGGELTRLTALLRAAHLARTSGSGRGEVIEPFHDRVRETVMSRLHDAPRAAWHARVATVLEATGSSELEAIAQHWRDAGDAVRAASFAARAGDQASRALAFDRAVSMYKMAIDLDLREGAEGRALLTRLGDALGNAGRGEEAAVVYLGAVNYGAPPAESVELERRAAENLLRSGYIDEAMAGVRAVMAAFGIEFPRTPDLALASLRTQRRDLARRGLAFEERAAAGVRPEVLTKIDVCWSASLGLAMVDPIRGADFQAQNLALSLDAGEPYRVARAFALEAAFAAAVGGAARARAPGLLATAGRIAERDENPHALGLTSGVRGVIGFLDGRFRESLAELDRSEQILRERCAGVPWERGSVLTFAVWDLWFLGELRELGRRAAHHLREAEDRGDRYLVTSLRTGFANARWLVLGDPESARRDTAEAIARWSRAGFHLQHFFDLLARGQIALYEGEGEAGHLRAMERWPDLEGSLALRIQLVRVAAHHLRARLALAAAEASRGEARRAELLAAACRSARRIEAERMRWARPLATLARAGAAALRGETESAAALLAQAASGFDEAEMALFAAAARLRLGGLIGGDAGRAARDEATSWMEAQGVAAPARVAAMLAPGFG